MINNKYVFFWIFACFGDMSVTNLALKQHQICQIPLLSWITFWATWWDLTRKPTAHHWQVTITRRVTRLTTRWARLTCLDLDPIKETLFDLVFLAALNLDHGTVGMEVETEKYLLLIALLLQIWIYTRAPRGNVLAKLAKVLGFSTKYLCWRRFHLFYWIVFQVLFLSCHWRWLHWSD